MKIKKEKISDALEKYGLAYKKSNEGVVRHLAKNNLTEFQIEIMSKRFSDEDFEIYKNDVVSHYYNFLKLDKNIDRLADVDKAANLIIKHIKNNSHIAIATDYDCDGVNSAAVLYKSLLDVFKYPEDRVTTFINKRRDGNGFNQTYVKRIKDIHNISPIDLIIGADHGSSDNNAFKEFKDLNIDMVITDHHQIPGNINPDNCTVFINNQRSDSTYSKDISGCFVAFLVMVNTYKVMYPNARLDIFNFITPYVALSTISDVMSLKVPMNRHIVKTGLNEINSFRNKAWIYIKRVLDISGKFTYKELGFKLAPLINTGNRIDSENLSFELLIAKEPETIMRLADELSKLNNFRKTVQKDTIKKVKPEVVANPYKNSIVIIMESELSISGIIAANIGEAEYKPTVCFLNNPRQDELVGSSRAIVKGLDIVSVYRHIHEEDSNIFVTAKDGKVKFGGHEGAAGCSIYRDKLEDFKKLFDKYCSSLNTFKEDKTLIYIDMFLPEHKLTPSIIKPLEALGPYGKDWLEPLFTSVLYVERILIFGTMAKISFATTNGKEITGIHFFRTQHDINPSNIKDIIKFGTKVLVTYNVNLENIRHSLEFSLNVNNIQVLEK